MEDCVQNLIHLERAEPKRRVLRSDGALYLFLLLLVFGVILLGNELSARFGMPRFYVQIVLYALLLALAYTVYRTRIVAYRYTITDRMFAVERLVGRKERVESHVHLSDIAAVRPYGELDGAETGRRRALYCGRRADALGVVVNVDGRRETLLVSPSQEGADKLIEAWKNSRK